MTTQLWNKVLKGIQARVSPSIFETWFKPLRPLQKEGGVFRIQVPNPMFRDWIASNYSEILRDALCGAGYDGLTLEFVEREDEAHLTLTPPASPSDHRRVTPSPSADNHIGILNPNYRFEHFVIGPSNQFAHAAAIAVAQSPSKAYNPLYIYGGVGLGKTHLVQSIGFTVREQFPQLRTAYVPAEKFTNEMISSIGSRTQIAFRDKYRKLDVLLLDDIQFLAGKTGTQEELFHTFNALHEAQKQVVISSDCHPRELQNMEERLRSRFEWGLIADIQPPDLETKVAILYEKAKIHETLIPEDVALLIAGKIKSNIRELEGCLIRLIAFSRFKGRPINLDLAIETFQNLHGDDGRSVTVEAIQKHVAAFYKLKVAELKGKTHKATIVLPRQVAMYLSKQLTQSSLPELGEKFGGKHHSTVLHAIRKIERMMKEDPVFQHQVSSFLRSFQ